MAILGTEKYEGRRVDEREPAATIPAHLLAAPAILAPPTIPAAESLRDGNPVLA
jgi:hypothetical protein